MPPRGFARLAAPLLALLALVDAGLVIYAVYHAPYPLRVSLGSPTAYLNIYIHIPMAWGSYLLYTLAFASAILYLTRGKEKLDAYVRAFVLTGSLYAVFTLVSGMAWASESWGAAWSWDPRETGVLLLLLAYILYFVLRSSIPDPDRASRLSAVYAVAAYSMVPISFLAPRVAASSLHPTVENFRDFMQQPAVLRVFIARVLMASVIAVLLSYTLAERLRGEEIPFTRSLRYVGAGLVMLGMVIGFIVASPYLAGGVERVLGARLVNGSVVALNLSGSGYVKLAKPLHVQVVDGKPSIIGHIVRLNGGSVEIVIHWSVALNAAMYMVLLGLLMLYISRLRNSTR